MTQSLVCHDRSIIRENGQETRPAATSGLFEQLSAGAAESVRLQTQLNERFAVRLLEFGNSLRAVQQTCRQIDARMEILTAGRVEVWVRVNHRSASLRIFHVGEDHRRKSGSFR